MWDVQATKLVNRKSADFSLKKIAEKDQRGEEDKSEDDITKMEVSVTDNIDAMAIENFSAANSHF